MKRRILLSIALLSIILMGYSQVQKDGIKLINFPEQSILKKSVQLISEQQLGQIILLPNEHFDQMEAAKMITRLDKLPKTMLTKINHEGIIIKLFTGKLTDNRTAAHLSGVVPRGYVNNTTWDIIPGIGGGKMVLVKIGSSAKGMGHSSVNLELHELAHSIDRHLYKEIRNNPGFIKIWNQEKKQMFPDKDYFLDYPGEYFAECFAYFYLGGEYRETLRSKAPQTYELIKKLS